MGVAADLKRQAGARRRAELHRHAAGADADLTAVIDATAVLQGTADDYGAAPSDHAAGVVSEIARHFVCTAEHVDRAVVAAVATPGELHQLTAIDTHLSSSRVGESRAQTPVADHATAVLETASLHIGDKTIDDDLAVFDDAPSVQRAATVRRELAAAVDDEILSDNEIALYR